MTTQINYKNKTFTLTQEAYLSGRLFDGGYNPDLKNGEEYQAEYVAQAFDDEGEEYLVVWRFFEAKGNELEDAGDYDWDSIHDVEYFCDMH